jgi:hypothetical protein
MKYCESKEEGKSSKGEDYIWRKAVVKHKSSKRGNNHRLQKYHIEYRLNISNISN